MSNKINLVPVFNNENQPINTASVEEIVNKMLQRNKHNKAYDFYNQVMIPRVAEKFENPHHDFPGHPIKEFPMDWHGDTNSDYFEPFEYNSTMPKVISEIKCEDNTDYIVDLIIHKHEWNTGNTILKRNHRAKCIRAKLEKLTDEVIQCPMFLVEMAARLDSDPDPNFNSRYNWYYAGNGNMQVICIHSVDYSLYSNFNTVYLSRLRKESSSISQPSASFKCEEYFNILETICSSQNIVALRTKQRIYILKIIATDDDLDFEPLKEFDSESAFTSISFDSVHTNILYVTTIDNKLTLVNIDRMTGKTVELKHDNESLVNNWHCVRGVGRGSYMHVNSSVITLYDKRTHEPTTSYTGLKGIVDLVYCNDITAAKACEDSPSMYFATDHHVFLMDTRAVRSKLKVVQRWMHGLQCAPAYMALEKVEDNREFLVVASQWCEDACVVSNYADSVVNLRRSGVCMPYHPPHVLDALKFAREKMLCFDLHNPIDRRLAVSTSGLALYKHNENVCILTHNALGDIFLRTLYPKYMESFIEDDGLQVLHEWSKSYKIERSLFVLSSLENIAGLWKRLQAVPRGCDFGPRNPQVVIDKSKLYKAYENQELLPELLDAWVNDDKKKFLTKNKTDFKNTKV